MFSSQAALSPFSLHSPNGFAWGRLCCRVAGCLEVKEGLLSAVPSVRFRALDAVSGKTDGTVEGMGAEILHTALFRKP